MCRLRNSIYLSVCLVSIVSCAVCFVGQTVEKGGQKGKPFAFRRKSINWWSLQLFCSCSRLLWFDIWDHSCSSYVDPKDLCRRRFSFCFFLLNQNFFLLCFIYLLHRGVGRLNDVHPSDFGRGVSRKTRLFRTKSTLTQHGAKPARRWLMDHPIRADHSP
jgi:hypothetical protein